MSPAIISGFFIQADINEIFDCGTQIFVFVVDDFEFALQINVADSNSFHVALFERVLDQVIGKDRNTQTLAHRPDDCLRAHAFPNRCDFDVVREQRSVKNVPPSAPPFPHDEILVAQGLKINFFRKRIFGSGDADQLVIIEIDHFQFGIVDDSFGKGKIDIVVHHMVFNDLGIFDGDVNLYLRMGLLEFLDIIGKEVIPDGDAGTDPKRSAASPVFHSVLKLIKKIDDVLRII